MWQHGGIVQMSCLFEQDPRTNLRGGGGETRSSVPRRGEWQDTGRVSRPSQNGFNLQFQMEIGAETSSHID